MPGLHGEPQIDIRHEEDWFTGLGSLRLYRQSWLPAGDPKAVIIIVHGLFEHSGRYGWLSEHLAAEGFACCSFDQRGHGRSEGLHGYVNRFSDFQRDLETFISIIRRDVSNRPLVVFGHSVGGTIATGYAIDHQEDLSALVLSAATTLPGSSVTRVSIAAARVLSALLPKMGIADIDASAISRNRDVVDAYINDPLVYCGKIRARLGAELINAIERSLPSRMSVIRLPILIMHGTEDRLSNTEGSRFLYDSVSSPDKTLKYYEGFYHEILNEPGREEVLRDLVVWLGKHIGAEKIAESVRRHLL